MEDKNEFAYQEIKRQILTGMLTNDSAISENKLVSMLDISRTPIRAALQRLQYEGFIRIIRNQGIVINELSVKEADQICDLRIALEQFLLEKSMPHMTEADIAALEENLKIQRKAIEAQDIDSFFALDARFHKLTASNYDNDKIKNIVDNCRELFVAYHYQSYSRKNRLQTLVEEHQMLLNAIKAQDVERGKFLISEHISKGVVAMLRSS